MITAFIELFETYIGTLKQDSGRLVFTSVNDLVDHWGKHRKVECSITLVMSYIVDPKRFSVSAEEKTLEIIGGSSVGSLTFEEAMNRVKKELTRYNFRHKAGTQTSLW